MKVKLQERADKLADACIHEFLEEKRKKEDWDRVSLIQDNIPRLNSKVYMYLGISFRKEHFPHNDFILI